MTQPKRWLRLWQPGRHGNSLASAPAAYHRLVILLISILGVLAIGVVLAVIASRSAFPGVEAPVSTQSYPGLPAGPVHAEDVEVVKLDLAFRGYRMDQVDAVLGRLREELAVRDHEIDRLRAEEERHGDV